MADFFSQVDDDIKNALLGGGARLRSVKGVGKKTEQKLRKAGITSISDLKMKRPDQIAAQTGLSENRIKTIIGNAGFTPRMTKEEQEADMQRYRETRGPRWRDNFEFSVVDQTAAQEFNLLRRSNQAVETDKQFRAPITTDLEDWKNSPDTLDFPGADTPISGPGGKLTTDMFEVKEKDVLGKMMDEKDF